MEQQLLAEATTASNAADTLQALSAARSLIINPSTSDTTISSLFETLSRSLQPERDPLSLHHTLSILSDLAVHRPHLSHPIFHAVRSFSLLCIHSSTRTLAAALSVLASIAESDQTLISVLSELGEGLFLNLCFRPSVSVRHWLLLNAERFRILPHLLLTVFLGFTKDPYPYVRRVALDGLVGFCKSAVVEDLSLTETCYCRAFELLTDMDDSVRAAAVRSVCQWGKLLVELNHNNNKKDLSDALFVQLCSMVRDMCVKVRVEAFDALGEISMVSEHILLQTLSKKVLSIIRQNTYPALCSTKPFEIPASVAAGAFVHGLEDEFCEVRRSACHSLHTLGTLSANFAGEALNLLVDVLNDDSMVVRLQALETLRCMALFNHLKVQEIHMHMFLSTLVDTSALVRSAARKVLRVTKLNDIAMFKLSVDGLLENLEMYPQDEVDVFSVLFNIGQRHANFVVDIIVGVADEIEPSCDGKLDFDCGRVAALLVLAISAPLSSEQSACSIPPRIFSYAVTLLGRISHALNDVMDQDTLLAYLSHCSRSTVISATEFYFKKKETFLPIEDSMPNNARGEVCGPAEMQFQQLNDGTPEIHSKKTQHPRKVGITVVRCQVADHNEMKSVEVILEKVKDIWQLIQLGFTDDVLRTLRILKEGLTAFATSSYSSTSTFTLQYLRVVKLLAKIWQHFIFPRKICSYGMGELGLLLEKLDRNLGEMRYRFIGLDKQEELHILELVLLNYILRLSSTEPLCDCTTTKKLYSTLSRVEFLQEEISSRPSNFVTELKKSFHNSINEPFCSPLLFRKLVEFFSLEHFTFSGKLKHIKAELGVHDNDFNNPLRFIPGLPIGLPLEITLYNISSKNRLWLQLAVHDAFTEFVFLDLDQFGGSNQFRKFTFTAPFYKTPKANSFTLRVCVGMECLSEDVHSFKRRGGPKRELVYLCKEKEVFLLMR